MTKLIVAMVVAGALALLPLTALAHGKEHHHGHHPRPTPACQKVPISQLPYYCHGAG